MKALSIKQPWAWLICKGYKDVENRNWGTSYTGRIYIHASKNFDNSAFNFIRDKVDDCVWQSIYYGKLSLGAIIGEATLTNVIRKIHLTESDHVDIGSQQAELEYLKRTCPSYFSPWFTGKYGFVLVNPVLYEKPVPYRGKLGLFDVNLEQQIESKKVT